MPDTPNESRDGAQPSASSPNSSVNSSGSLSFDRVAHLYDETRGYPPAVAAEIARGLVEIGPFPPGSAVLEIGIGTGRIALPLLELGVHMTGVDISPQMIARLREKYDERLASEAPETAHRWGLLRVELADMTALPFVDGAFDGVLAVHVLHLVPTWKQAFGEALNVIKPGGALLVGQDVTHGISADLQAQDEWVKIIRRLGFDPVRPGATGYSAIIGEARARGLAVEEHTIATWQRQMSPHQALESLTQREWSRTWGAPDDLFAESLRELAAWMQTRYAGALDTPQQGVHSFKVARIAKAA